jgi:hypothetical protein
MRQQTLKTAFLLSLLIVINACTKPSTTTNNNNNNNNNGTTTPLATNGIVIFNGKSYTVNNPVYYGKFFEKTFHVGLQFTSGDSLFDLFVSTAEYLPASGTIAFNNNTMPLSAGQASWSISIFNKTTFVQYFEYSLVGKSGDIIITKGANDMQFVTNNSQGYKTDGTTGSKLSFNIKKNNPTTPNTSFTIPSGMDPNNITIGTTTWNHTTDIHSFTREEGLSNASTQRSAGDIKALDFYFNDGLPKSGTYDIVTSLNDVTDGKVYVKYVQLTPVLLLNSTNTAQKIVVENTNGEVKIYAKNIDLGTQVLNAFINY